jgi:hypothetical protein
LIQSRLSQVIWAGQQADEEREFDGLKGAERYEAFLPKSAQFLAVKG